MIFHNNDYLRIIITKIMIIDFMNYLYLIVRFSEKS